MVEKTTIEIEKETRTRLRTWKSERDFTYDEAIGRLLEIAQGGEGEQHE